MASEGMVLNQSETARFFGVVPATIREWERRGCPVESRGRKGVQAQYNTADLIRWREQQAALAASGDLSAMDIDEAKRRKLAAEAAIVEIELDKARGELVEVSVVMEAVGKGLDACRSRLLSIGSKIAPDIALETDAATVKEIVDDAVHEALDEISGPAFAYSGEASGDITQSDIGLVQDEDAPTADTDT